MSQKNKINICNKNKFFKKKFKFKRNDIFISELNFSLVA